MSNSKESSRRKFLKQASFLSAAAVALPRMADAFPLPEDDKGYGYTFLFQGDSITDGNRTRNQDLNHILGDGYPYLIAARLWFNTPKKKFHFINRGVSGNQMLSLTSRWDADTLALKPNVLSILIGVNDSTFSVYGNKTFTPQNYEDGYRALLTKTKQQLPDIELVIMEPFILPVGRVKDKWDDYQREITARQQISRKLADEFNAVFVPLQDVFNQAAEKYGPAEYWMWDGIHSMANGHELMAREWIKHVGKKLKYIR